MWPIRASPRTEPSLGAALCVLQTTYAVFRYWGDHKTMKRRRFMVLAVVLVAVNAFFWLAQGGFALPRALINQFFGQQMIRAEVLVQTPNGAQDYRIDRGVIRTLSPGSIIIREKNGDMVPIQISTSATVTGLAGRNGSLSVLRRGMRVLVIALANQPADTIQVEGIGP